MGFLDEVGKIAGAISANRRIVLGGIVTARGFD